jgi:DNA-binding protein HU-beta
MHGGIIVTKADLVNSMAEKAGLTKAEAERALKAFTDTIEDALKAGDKVALVGFGTFSVGERAARTGQNPQTGQKIEIAAAKVPKFKAGKALKDSIN